MKKLRIICLSVVCLIIAFITLNTNAATQVTVYVNDEMVYSDVKPCIIDGRTMIPARAVCDALGCEVYWDEASKSVSVIRGDLKSVLTIDSKIAVVYNGNESKEIVLDVPAMIISDRTMVPVRFVSESMNAQVLWDEIRKSVKINMDFDLALTTDETISLNDDVSTLPAPDRIDKGMYGFDWYVYSSNSAKYKMVAVKENEIVGFFSNAAGFKTNFGIEYGKNSEDVSFNGYTISLYRDELSSNEVSGILVVKDSAVEEIDTTTPEFFRCQSEQMFDMVNAFRIANGKEILKWDEAAAVAAKNHSGDMAQNNYFSHTGLNGSDVLERYISVNNVSWTSIGENICAGYAHAPDVFFALMNSPGHRNNMLNPDFKYLGTGMAFNGFSDYKFYATQVFVSY